MVFGEAQTPAETEPATANPNHTLTTPYAQYSFYLARQNLMINKGQGILVM